MTQAGKEKTGPAELLERALESVDWEAVGITDDEMFKEVMRDEEYAVPLVEMVLGRKVAGVRYLEVEKTLSPRLRAHGVRMDVLMADGSGDAYDVEMQAGHLDELPGRLRAYQAAADSRLIARGAEYKGLGRLALIFFCTGDPFGLGVRRYEFEQVDRASGAVLDDGVAKIVFFAAGEGEEDGRLAGFLDYVAGGEPKGEYALKVDARVRKIRAEAGWRERRMFAELDRMNEILRERGEAFERGRGEGESRLASLVSALLAEGRADEVARAASDPAFREAQYAEHGIA